MKKYLFITAFFLSTAISFAQHRGNIIYLDAIVLPNDSIPNCIITFKIPYRNLLFKKNGTGYLSGITLNFEIADKNKKSIYKSISKGVFLPTYKQTESKNEYLEGLLKLKLTAGKYRLKSDLRLKYLNKTFRNPQIAFSVDSNNTSGYTPIFLSKAQYLCKDKPEFKFLNMGEKIPFSPSAKMLMIPIKDTSITKIHYSIFQRNKNILTDSVSSFVKSDINLLECNDKIFVNLNSDDLNWEIFMIKNLEKYLDEGKGKIIVTYGKNNLKKYSFDVFWFNKPIVLRDVEFSISLIEKIWGVKKAGKLLDLPDNLQYDGLKKFLSKYDANKSTKFNEVMGEFYNRVDYAIFNFEKDVNKKNALSDMGRIYIKFGKPENRKRIFSKKYNVIEIWEYKKPKRKFIFVDKTGLGDYKLIK